MRTFLVTGGAGFIGSHIVEALVQRGDQVRVLDNLSTGSRKNLRAVEGAVDFWEGDVADWDIVSQAVADVDCVFHQAALASVPLSIEQPLETHRVCVTGTVTILHAAQQARVRRVVYAASSSAYGNSTKPRKHETDLPDTVSPYAAAKLAGEWYCHAFHQTLGVETVVLRYFNVFGPRQDPDGPYSAVIPLFITDILRGEAPTIFGDGLQTRDFTYVDNVVYGNLLAADTPQAAGCTLNLANGQSTSLLELLQLLSQQLGRPVQPVHADARPGDIRHSMADISAAENLLGYKPQVPLEAGLRQSIEYYRDVLNNSS